MARRDKYGPDAVLATDDEAALIVEIFGDDADAAEADDSAFEPLTDDEIEKIVGSAVEDAIDFIESEIAEARMKAQRYFDGEVDIGAEEGRSKVVATKCRDTVRAVKPSIQRVFMTADRPVEFIPAGPEDVASMEQAGTYAAAKFRQSNGYQILRDVTHDALVKKAGFTKTYWGEYDRPKVYSFTDLDDAQREAVLSSEGVEVLSETSRPDEETIRQLQAQIDQAMQQAQQMEAMGQPVDPAQLPQMPDPLPQLHDMRVLRRQVTGKLCIDTVPPEEFFVDRNARSDADFYVIGHRTVARVADLIALGVDEDIALDLDLDEGETDQEDEERRGYLRNRDETESADDPSMKQVTVTEAYMRVDVDGAGTPILHKFLLGGSKNKLLSYEPVDDHPFASWHIDPEPHTFFGRSLVEIIEQDQDAATSIIRGILDNVTMTNNPRMEAVRGQVDVDDLLNNEIGAIVRVNAPGMLRDLSVPFVAGQTLPALQYLDSMIETKTGVTRASMGLDPDALQSTTRAAVTATVQAAAGQVEVMVANLAYTGMRRLFCQILKLMAQHSTRAEMVRINGQYVPMDPRVWDVELDAEINVGLGTGREDQKGAMLGQVLQLQMQFMQSGLPLAGPDQLRNTIADMLAINGLRSADRYLLPPPPAPPQNQAPPPDPNAGLVQAEQIKAQAKLQSDQMRMQLDMMKAQMQDDRERDRMTQDLELAMAQIAGKYGIAVDTAAIKAQQDATNAMMQLQMQQPQQPQQQPPQPGPSGGAM